MILSEVYDAYGLILIRLNIDMIVPN
jgi:hypothetical protein